MPRSHTTKGVAGAPASGSPGSKGQPLKLYRGDQTLEDRPEVPEITQLLQQKPLKLADYHAIGQQLQQVSKDTELTSCFPGWRKQLAGILRVSESTLNKCLQFAEKYRAEELPGLVEMSVTWGRLTIAFAIPNKASRHRLLKQAREEGWNDRQLQKAVQGKNGSRRGGGRRRKEATSHGLAPDLGELSRLAALCEEFQEKVWSMREVRYLRELGRASASGKKHLARQLADAITRVSTLKEACEQTLVGLNILKKIATDD